MALIALLLVGACVHAPVPAGLPGPEADRQLAALVALRLSADQRLCPFDIDVQSINRTVRLEGQVGSPADQRRAEELSLKAGADRVLNELTLDPSSGDRHRC